MRKSCKGEWVKVRDDPRKDDGLISDRKDKIRQDWITANSVGFAFEHN